MTGASRDPEVFLTQVNDAIEDVNSAIGEFVERSANLINSHLAEAGGILGTLVAGPLGGLVGGVAVTLWQRRALRDADAG